MGTLIAILFFGILTLWVPDRWALSFFQVALLALAMGRLVMRIREGRGIGVHPVGLLLASAVAWGLIQIAARWSVDVLKTQEAALDWFVNVVAFSLALDLSGSAEQRERFFRATLVFGTLLAITSIFTLLTSPPGTVFWRFAAGTDQPTLGPFVYRNQYAAFVEAILPLVLLSAIRDSGRWLLYTLAAAILFGSVVAGGSRAGTILCLAEILLIPAIAFARGLIPGRVFLRVILGSLTAMMLAVGVVGWEGIWNRLQEPNPYAMRLQLVQSSVAMLRARPWTGFGLGTWSTAYPGYALFDDGLFVNQAHNDWIQWGAEGGIPFLLITLGIAVWSVRPALRSIWGVGILVVLVHALIDYPMQQRPALAAFVFALLGVGAAGEHPGPARQASAAPLRNRS